MKRLAVVLLLLAALVLPAGGGNQEAQAQGGDGLDPNIVGLDMDPSKDPANTATSLGSIERCIEVGGVGSTFDIDVFLNDVPLGPMFDSDGDTTPDTQGHNLGGYEYRMLYNDDKLEVNATDHIYLMADKSGSVVVDTGDCSSPPPVPPCDTDGSLDTQVTDSGGLPGAELPGALGTTDRYTMQVVGGAGT